MLSKLGSQLGATLGLSVCCFFEVSKPCVSTFAFHARLRKTQMQQYVTPAQGPSARASRTDGKVWAAYCRCVDAVLSIRLC